MNQSLAPSAVLAVPAQREGCSKEFDILCACAAVELSPERAARIADSSKSALDWNVILRLAEHHGVLPLLARNLLAHAQDLPPQVATALQSAYETNVRKNLWFASELVRICSHFEESNILAAPYKGPVLAESVYGDLALRSFSDLDFLISPAGFEVAKRLLAELGYQPSTLLRPAVERFWLRKGYECSFNGPAGKHLIELQWNLLPYFYAVDLRNDELLARARQTSMGGRSIPCLAPEDSLLVLCLHAAKHVWMRLIWVCDIAETMRIQEVDWGVVVSRARELGVLRIVGMSLWLVEKLLGVRLPVAAKEVIESDPEVVRLGELFAARLERSATYDFESPEYFRLILELRERRTDRYRYLWRLMWTPGPGDLAAVQLPEALFPLYRLVRLARLVRKLV